MKRMLTRKPFSNMKGLTVMEVLLALVLGFIVVAGIIAGFIQARLSANANKAVNDMNSIVAATESYVAAGNAASAATYATLTSGGFLPTPFNSPWGSAYTIQGTVNGTVDITVGGIGGSTTSPADKNCAAITGQVGTSATATAGTSCKFTYPI